MFSFNIHKKFKKHEVKQVNSEIRKINNQNIISTNIKYNIFDALLFENIENYKINPVYSQFYSDEVIIEIFQRISPQFLKNHISPNFLNYLINFESEKKELIGFDVIERKINSIFNLFLGDLLPNFAKYNLKKITEFELDLEHDKLPEQKTIEDQLKLMEKKDLKIIKNDIEFCDIIFSLCDCQYKILEEAKNKNIIFYLIIREFFKDFFSNRLPNHIKMQYKIPEISKIDKNDNKTSENKNIKTTKTDDIKDPINKHKTDDIKDPILNQQKTPTINNCKNIKNQQIDEEEFEVSFISKKHKCEHEISIKNYEKYKKKITDENMHEYIKKYAKYSVLFNTKVEVVNKSKINKNKIAIILITLGCGVGATAGGLTQKNKNDSKKNIPDEAKSFEETNHEPKDGQCNLHKHPAKIGHDFL